MIDRLIRKAREAAHLRQCRAVYSTPAAAVRDDGVIVFSMIGTRVVAPYLVAAKSFMYALGRGRVVLLDDGSLTANDNDALASHLGNPEIRSIRDVDTGDAPRGGCWERLMTLIDLSATDYVIQLDSDTVTLGAVTEVRAAIDAGRSFTIVGGTDGEAQGLKRLTDFRREVYPAGPDVLPAGSHVQTQIEARMDRLPDPDARRYVRACAAFTGFAPGSVTRPDAQAFSRAAEAAVGGDVWKQWGSEQVASNYLIANTPDAVLLPYARYYHFWDDGDRADPGLVHFPGTHRYTGNAYARATAAALSRLNG
jgi:hypothetical protein